ncbi:MAG: transposase [bacterium]|nr:transposase [bacterium]
MRWQWACIDFPFWAEAKRRHGVYFISREKANMDIQVIGMTPGFDREDPRNVGVDADEFVGPGGGGTMLRRVTYTDPKGTTYKYLTTEMRQPAWVIVLLFKARWDIEKVFDEVKNKLLERKSWASSDTAKITHANFICLTHNLMVLLEDEIENVEQTCNLIERKRKSKREEEAKGAGAGYVATAIGRFTVRSVKFVRWLRNFLYSEAPWSHAIARLAKVYSTW